MTIKISEMTEKTPLDGTEELEINDGGSTKKATSQSIADLATLVLSDGDYGDITVSGTGTVFTVDADAITYDKMQDTSATDVLLGRETAGGGTVEEIACTAAGRALIDDASASAQRTTLGLEIGADVQAYDEQLDDFAGLTPTKGRLAVADGTNWLPLTVGTDDYVLTADSSQSLGIKWADAGSGTEVLLETITASGDDDVEFITTSYTGYSKLIIEWTDVTFSADNTAASLTVSDDGGTTYESANYNEAWMFNISDDTTPSGGGNVSTSDMSLIFNTGNDTGESAFGNLEISNPESTTLYKILRVETTCVRNDGNILQGIISGSWKGGTGALDGFLIAPSAGTISGTFKLKGVI